MQLLIFITFAAISLFQSNIHAYNPPGNWHEWPSLAEARRTLYGMDVYRSVRALADTLIWHRGDEGLSWSLVSPPHNLDRARSILSHFKSRGTSFEEWGPVTLSSESRCAGKAWWVRWTTTEPNRKRFEEQELIFENRGREALILYSYTITKGPDAQVFQSMLKYCAQFNK